MKNSEKYSYSEDAYNKIISGIMSGELKPGQVLSEHDLSQMYNLGRTPIREALKRLEGEGFIINKDRKKKIYELSQDDIREIFDLKVEIEGMIARRAAECKSKKERQKMADIVARMEALMAKLGSEDTFVSPEHINEWLRIDTDFHNQLYIMADNSRAKIIIDNLNAQWHRIRVGLSAITSHIDISVKEHLRIAQAVMDNEAEVASVAIKSHFISLRDRIVTLMDTFKN